MRTFTTHLDYLENWGAFYIAIEEGLTSEQALREMQYRYRYNEGDIDIRPDKPRRRITLSDIPRIERLRSQGIEWREIAQEYGYTMGGIRTMYHRLKGE